MDESMDVYEPNTDGTQHAAEPDDAHESERPLPQNDRTTRTNTEAIPSPGRSRAGRNASHLARFMRDHLWAILVWAVGAAIFAGAFVLFGGAPENAAYCTLLFALALAAGLAWRFFATAPLYALEHAATELAASPDDDAKAAFDAALHRAAGSSPARQARRIAIASETFYNARLKRQLDANAERESMMLRWAHHAKTPLSIMALVADKHPENDDFHLVANATSELKRSLDQLLHIARATDAASDVRIERVKPADALAACVKRMRGYFLERGVFASFHGDAELVVRTDAKWLDGIIEQIVANAVRYSRAGGTVHLSCGADEQNRAFISIADEGCGIAPEDLPRIFDLFFTGKNGRTTQESSGIGLYLAKEAADLLGIELRVESEEGRGSTFTLLFAQSRNERSLAEL